MREIVHIQAGQCGNQIGAKVNIICFVQYANRRRPHLIRLQRPLLTVSANMADGSKHYCLCVVPGLFFAVFVVRFPLFCKRYFFRFPVKSLHTTFSSTPTTTSPLFPLDGFASHLVAYTRPRLTAKTSRITVNKEDAWSLFGGLLCDVLVFFLFH